MNDDNYPSEDEEEMDRFYNRWLPEVASVWAEQNKEVPGYVSTLF